MALVPVTIYGNPFTTLETTFLQGFADLTHTQGDVFYINSSGQVARLGAGTNGYVLTTGGAGANPSWTSVSGLGTVTSVSVVSANGFAGTVATATTTPAITLTTTVTGILKGNATAISAATAGSDYVVGSLGLAAGQTIAGGTLTTQGLTLRANAADTTTGTIAITTSTASSSTATGALTIAGGLGVAGATFLASANVGNLTASQAVVTDASKNLASLGYTTTATASNLAERDASANLLANNFIANFTSTVSAGGTTVLTVGSSQAQALTGTSAQTFQLPDATTLALGMYFSFDNNSSQALTITNAGTTTLYTLPAGGVVEAVVTNVGTANGVWDFHTHAPATVTWGTGVTGLVFNTALTTTAAINAGASSSTAPVFIPQRGSATTGLGGDSTNLYLILGGSSKFSVGSTGHITVEGVTSTGATGTNLLVFATSPTLTTPTIGAATATSINKVAITAPATSATITIADGKTLTASNTLTLAGTDSTTMTFPTTSASVARTDAAQTFTGTQTFSQIVTTNNAITATANAATVPITSRISTVTNNSAATLTITITTTSAVDGMMVIVRILDFSAVAQTITWVNTENSTVTAPTTSNGSTTLFLTVGFIYNGGTSKWRCIASA